MALVTSLQIGFGRTEDAIAYLRRFGKSAPKYASVARKQETFFLLLTKAGEILRQRDQEGSGS